MFVTASYTDENNERHYLDFPLTIFENLKYPIDHEDFNPPMTFVFNDSLNPYLIHPMISFTFNPDQIFSGSILTAVPDRYKKNNSLDTWTLQLKDSNFQDSIILYHID